MKPAHKTAYNVRHTTIFSAIAETTLQFLGKRGRQELGDILVHYTSIFDHCENRPEKVSHCLKNAKYGLLRR